MGGAMENIFECKIDKTIPLPMQVRGVRYKDFKAIKHRHQYYEINIICSGKGIHTVGGESFFVSRGDVFMIPPEETHSYTETCKLEVFHLLYRPDFLKNNMQEAIGVRGFTLFAEIEPFLRKNSNAPKFLHLNEYKMCDLERDLDIIDDEGRYREQPVEYVRRHTALKVLYELSEFLYQQMYNDKKNESDSGTKYEQQIFQTLEYIHANYDKKITVEDLASRVFLSRSTFIRSFNLITRTSPNRYIRQYRASKALELMKDGKIKKSEVARLSGYYDASHLYRELK